MKKIVYMLALSAALAANAAVAQYRDEVINRTYEPGVYTDDRGEYRWQTIERRVWIPEYQTRGILGVGVRTIPGHYEMRTDRVKVYTNSARNSDYEYGESRRNKRHPHGMPPGQRKKVEKNRGNY